MDTGDRFRSLSSAAFGIIGFSAVMLLLAGGCFLLAVSTESVPAQAVLYAAAGLCGLVGLLGFLFGVLASVIALVAGAKNRRHHDTTNEGTVTTGQVAASPDQWS